ncbi:methyltransferase [Crossiella sp. CA198]|uniref:methyltransferase n=1 Tax=Crossiella sp. CA198 TaxID=3455607 RepID=UPI003F8D0663
MTSTLAPILAGADRTRLRTTLELVRANDTESVLAAAMPTLPPAERAALAGRTRFAHAAVLIFPATLDGLREELAHHGLDVGAMTPSVVVRDRLSRRYGVPAAELQVGILRAPVTDAAGQPRELEIFAMATPPELAHLATDERRHGRENHVALAVPAADPVLLAGVQRIVAAHLRPDGGGYNRHENCTVLYFRDAQHPNPAFRRLELISTGDVQPLLAAHLRESAPGLGLLRLLTGAWATQAIAAAVELGLPDHLVGTAAVPALATATGTHQDSLGRLLRYLTTLGVVRTVPTGYALTELGELLRTEVDGSMHSLARMYGGPFYRSFGALTEAVRTGEESFAKVFGAHHFTHLAGDPELAGLFHQSMAASNAMFGELTRQVDFTAAGTVIDIAGGNGELLARVLTANPTAHGILFDLPSALVTAGPTLEPVAERVTLVPGDFTKTVPAGGDVYLLSRVLHDWDDARCQEILAICAAAMPEHAELMIIERLLPEAGPTDSLAVPWDIHMLCNVGGRERTESHYRSLLAAAGFELTRTTPLPLDGFLLRARKAG